MKLTTLAAVWFGGLSLSYFEAGGLATAALFALICGTVTLWRLGAPMGLAAFVFAIGGFAIYEFSASEGGESPATPLNGDFRLEIDSESRAEGTRVSFTGTVDEPGHWDGERILVEAPAFFDLDYGDLIRLSGEVVPLDLAMPGDRYLLEQNLSGRLVYPLAVDVISSGHGSWWREGLIDIRTTLSRRLDRALPEPASALARGMLLGERSSIDSELREDLSAAGTAHLIAISGQNLALLAGAVVLLVTPWFNRKIAAYAAITVLIFYTLLLGAPPSVLRAAVMGIVLVLAPVFGRQPHALAALSLTAILMTALDPAIISDLSFQLSLAASASLVLVAPVLTSAIETMAQRIIGRPLPVLSGMLGLTTAASLATWPIIAINFGTISIAALGSNFLVIPTFVPTLIASLLAIPASFLPGGLAAACAWPSWILLEYFGAVTRLFADANLVIEVEDFGSLQAFAMYAGIAVLVAALRQGFDRVGRPAARELRLGPAFIVPALLLGNAVAWSGWLDEDDAGRLSVTFLDVGQGDATLIETPAGERIIIDGGPDPERVVRELDARLGFGPSSIDLLLLTHMASDHATGALAVLQRYDVERIGWTGFTDGSEVASLWASELAGSQALVSELTAGDRISLAGGIYLDILGPQHDGFAGGENDRSMVVRLVYGEVEVMLMGDLEADGELQLLRSPQALGAELLKVGHHGSATSSMPELLMAVDPEFAVIPVGAANPYGHPSPIVLERLGAMGIQILRTDEDGRVTFVSDGQTIWRD